MMNIEIVNGKIKIEFGTIGQDCLFCGSNMFTHRIGEDDIDCYTCFNCKSCLWPFADVSEVLDPEEYNVEGMCCAIGGCDPDFGIWEAPTVETFPVCAVDPWWEWFNSIEVEPQSDEAKSDEGNAETEIPVCDVLFNGQCDRCDHPCDAYFQMNGYADGDDDQDEIEDDEGDYEDDPDWDDLDDNQYLPDESEPDEEDV